MVQQITFKVPLERGDGGNVKYGITCCNIFLCEAIGYVSLMGQNKADVMGVDGTES